MKPEIRKETYLDSLARAVAACLGHSGKRPKAFYLNPSSYMVFQFEAVSNGWIPDEDGTYDIAGVPIYSLEDEELPDGQFILEI